MLTSAAIIAGMCAGSICLASLAAKAADGSTGPAPVPSAIVQVNGGGNTPNGTAASSPRDPAAVGTMARKVGGPSEAGSSFLGFDPAFQGGVNVGTSASDGAAERRKGKVRVQDIPIVKKYDKASPVLGDSPPPPPPPPPPARLSSNGLQSPSTHSPQVWDGKAGQTRQVTVIQDMNPPPPAQQRFQDVPPVGNLPPGQQRYQDVPPVSPYQPSGAGNAALTKVSGATNPGDTQGKGHEGHIEIDSLQLGATPGGGALQPPFLGGVTVAAGDVNAPAAALAGDDTGSPASAGRRTYVPPTIKKRVDVATPATSRPNLGSLQSVERVGSLFLDSRGGDQGPPPGADAKLRLGTNAATAGAGGGPGCAAACTNNLNTGKPAVPSAVPTERFSINSAKVVQGVIAPPRGAGPSGAPVLQLNTVSPAAGVGAGTAGTAQVKAFQAPTGAIGKPAGGSAAPNLVRTR